jgi:outer membrane protein OmpA-like peptidoglycan-associated protein
MLWHCLRALALVPLLAVAASAQDQGDGDAVGAQAALANGKVLDIESKVLDIVGVTRGLDATLKDLGAKVTETEIHIELSGDVLFDFDKADLRPDALASLEKVGQVIKSYPKAKVLIEGYTDSKGDDKYNLKLSDRRASSVKAWLIQNAGIAKGQITAKGWGEAKPVAPNTKPDGSDDPDGRQKNRRVEITIKKA